MTLIEERNNFRVVLGRWYEQVEIDDIFKRCMEHYFSWSSIKIGLEPQYILSKEEATQLSQALHLLSRGTPLQYVLGTTAFMGLDLKVSPAVLIPRPETEELVEWILSNHPNTALRVWDLCSGSGCIALGLKAQSNTALTTTKIPYLEGGIWVIRQNPRNEFLCFWARNQNRGTYF